MKVIRSDKKGKLIELSRGKFCQCNFLEMNKGSVWGRHYHKKTVEYFYVFKGKLEVSFLFLKDKQKNEQIFKTGETFTVDPYTFHTIRVLRETQCLVLYSRKFSGKNPDLYHL